MRRCTPSASRTQSQPYSSLPGVSLRSPGSAIPVAPWPPSYAQPGRSAEPAKNSSILASIDAQTRPQSDHRRWPHERDILDHPPRLASLRAARNSHQAFASASPTRRLARAPEVSPGSITHHTPGLGDERKLSFHRGGAPRATGPPVFRRSQFNARRAIIPAVTARSVTVSAAPARSGRDAPRIDPSARRESTDVLARAESTDPSDPAEPTEKAEAKEPIDPIESADPTDPIERNELFEPTDRKEFSDQSDSVCMCASYRAPR